MRILITLLLVLGASTAVAQECDSSDDTVNFRSQADGKWHLISTWEQCFDEGGGTYAWDDATSKPGSTNFVTIRANHKVTVDTSGEECRNLHVVGNNTGLKYLDIIGDLTVHGGSTAAERTSTIDQHGRIQLRINGDLIFATNNHVLVQSHGSGKLIEGNSNNAVNQTHLIIDGVTLTIVDGRIQGALRVESGASTGHLVNSGEVRAGAGLNQSLALLDLGSIQGSGDWSALTTDVGELRFAGTECVTSLTGDFTQSGSAVITIGTDSIDVNVSTTGTVSGSVDVESGSKFCYECTSLSFVCDPSGDCACSA